MAPSVKNITAADAGATSATVDFTGLVSSGNFLVIHCESDPDFGTVNTPPGWTPFPGSPVDDTENGALCRATAFHRVSDGAETTVTLDGVTDHLEGS